MFGSALEQADQMLTAAGNVGSAARPILLFYGLSLAGRPSAAASTAADNNSYKLNGHGIKAPDLNQRPPLPALTLMDDGAGSFTQFALLLGSVSLPRGAQLGQLWAAIPDLLVTRGIVKTCGSAARLFFSPAVSLTTLIFATVLAVVNPRPGRRTPGVQRR